MINKKEFDLLLKEISQIENKIVEIKVLNQFDKANEFENRLSEIREIAKTIHLDQEGLSRGFDDISLSVLHDLIELKANVDVLTLTATPIPRTLQMAVTGIRSLSLLETPPKNRYPIQTYVIEYNEAIIREAIYRELSRGGQVFFLHNKISDINVVKKRLQKLVPEARICIGHGSMNRDELEDVITDFIDKKYDLFLCTTIIETGIDIPNSNTLIVDDSTRLGLSQMYQLRGRVGRSDRIAYAYFAYDGSKKISGASLKRLEAIKEYTQMGSGYKIAVRDLAIRGAGDILGKEQSGFINSIGMDMYMKLLNEVINKVKGIEEEEKIKYKVEVSKHIDKSYVSDDDIIIYIHKEISKIQSKEEKEKVINELTDRFGKLSNDILTYIEERYMESILRSLNIKSVMETNMLVSIIIPEEVSLKINGEELLMTGYKLSDDISFLNYNPAASSIQKETQFAVFHNSWISDSNYETIAYTTRFNNFGFGVQASCFYVPFTEYNIFGDRTAGSYYTEQQVV